MTNESLDPLRQTKTVLLTTYKRDGTAVATPVSIAFAGDRAFFRTYDKAWKAKRLRHNQNVEVAPSTGGGKATGGEEDARDAANRAPPSGVVLPESGLGCLEQDARHQGSRIARMRYRRATPRA